MWPKIGLFVADPIIKNTPQPYSPVYGSANNNMMLNFCVMQCIQKCIEVIKQFVGKNIPFFTAKSVADQLSERIEVGGHKELNKMIITYYFLCQFASFLFLRE